MLALSLSLILTALLLALPVMTWWAYKAGRKKSGPRNGVILRRLLAGCAAAAWAAHIIRYAALASTQGLLESRQAIQLSAPLGWLVWIVSLAGVIVFVVIIKKTRRT